MANKTVPALVLRDGDCDKRATMLRNPTLTAGLVQRAVERHREGLHICAVRCVDSRQRGPALIGFG